MKPWLSASSSLSDILLIFLKQHELIQIYGPVIKDANILYSYMEYYFI